MIALTLTQIAEAVGGHLVLGESGADADAVIEGAAQTDSREIEPGGIFFARIGESSDGHLYVDQAVERGAAALVVQHEVAAPVPQIIVEDATEALGELARTVVHRVLTAGNLTIVGITGSNGKTTTKNLVAAMAERLGATVASQKSFNNEVGGPITMLGVADDTRTLVAEMGASAEGEIARLTAMAPPHIGIVLAVGNAHSGVFGGIEATARTKAEMVRDLPADAVAVLNRDDPRVAAMAEQTAARVRWFGRSDSADVWADDIEVGAAGTRFTLHAEGRELPVVFAVLGEHHVSNALAAAATGLELGLTLEQVVETLEAATIAAPGRMQPLGGRDGITIVNDSYNASPESMEAGLKTLAQISKPGGRTIAVLGEMLELGEMSGEAHDRVGVLAVRLRISQLVIVGAGARRMHISAINEGAWTEGESVYFESQDQAYDYLLQTLRPNDTVLVKSSLGAGLLTLGDRLGEAFA